MSKKQDKTVLKAFMYLRDIFEDESDVFGFGGTTDERISEFTINRIAKLLREATDNLQEIVNESDE